MSTDSAQNLYNSDSVRLGVSEAAQYLKITPSTLRRLESDGKIKSERLSNGYRQYSLGDVIALKNSLEEKKNRLQTVGKPAVQTVLPAAPVFKKAANKLTLSQRFAEFLSLLSVPQIKTMRKFSYAGFSVCLLMSLIVAFRAGGLGSIISDEKGILGHSGVSGRKSLGQVLADQTSNAEYTFNVNVLSFFNRLSEFKQGLKSTSVETQSLLGLQTIDAVTETSLEKYLDLTGDVTSPAAGGLNNVIVNKIKGQAFGDIKPEEGYVLMGDGKTWQSMSTEEITSLGTIGTGTWEGDPVTTGYGGTGLTSYSSGDMLYASSADTLSALPVGTAGQILTIVSGVPTWAAPGESGNWVNGGNSFGADGSLGTNDTYGLNLETNNTSRLYISSTGNVGIGTTDPKTILHIFGTDGLVLPAGNIAQRPGTPLTGTIRYNSETQQFEGYGTTAWGSLGGVKDVNQDTYISAEDTPGSNNDQLKFFTNSGQRMTISATGVINVSSLTPGNAVYTDANNNLVSTPPAGGTIGFWQRTGTKLFPANVSDYLGVGTTNPGYSLEVAGNARITGGAIIQGGLNLGADGISNAGAVGGVTSLTVLNGGTLTFGNFGAGVLHTDLNGVVSSKAVNLGNADVTGTLTNNKGGTGFSTYDRGDMLYASAANTLGKLPIGGMDGLVLKVSGGIPTWGTVSGGPGGTCSNCIITDPSSNQVIQPTLSTVTGLIVAGAENGTADIFKISSFAQGEDYFTVDHEGNIILGGSSSLSTGVFSVAPTGTDPIQISPVPEGASKHSGTITSEDLTADVTWALPNISGVFCLTSGNCSGTGTNLGGMGTTNYMTRWAGPYLITNSLMYDSGDAIGLGTTSPSALLHLNQTNASTTTEKTVLTAATGTLTVTDDVTNQRSVQMLAPTLSVSSGKTVSNAATTYISGAPTNTGAGTLSNSYALWVDSGATQLDGSLSVLGNTSLSGTLGVSGNSTFSGTITQADGLYIATDEIRARDTGGLKLFTSAGVNGIMLTEAGAVGIGTTNPGAQMEVLGTSSQLKLSYDASNYAGFTLDSTGMLTLATNGTTVATLSDTGNVFTQPTSFTSPGDVSMAYDLIFTNPTVANVKSYGPLTLEAGKNWDSSNLVFKTYNQGTVLVDYSSDTTTAADHIAFQSTPLVSGAISTGIRNIYGFYNNPQSTAANSGGTTNVYGNYVVPSSTLATAGTTNVYGSYISGTATHASDTGTVNQYGIYIANGTSGTNGTSAKYGLYVEAPTGADTNYAAIFAGGNFGIGNTAPASLLTVGASGQFQVDSNGNIVKLNNVTYSWPASQAAVAGSVLSNDAAGNLSWASPSGTGVLGYWNRVATALSPSNLTDTLGLGTTAPAAKLEIVGTTQQLRLSYDGTYNTQFTVDSTGMLTIAPNGTTAATFSDTGNVFTQPTSFTSAGDVSMAYDLVFTNQNVANIKTDAPLVIDVGENFESNNLTLRTYNAGSIILESSNLWSDGTYTGIGTTAPTDKLDIAGGVKVGSGYAGIATTAPANGLLVQGNVGIGNSSPAALLAIGSTSQLVVTSSGYLGIGTTNPNDYAEIGGGMTIGAGYLGSGTAPANGLLVQGLVGIGTTNPSAGLEIAGTTTQLQLSYDTSNYAKWTVASDGTLTLNNSGVDVATYSSSAIGFNLPTSFNSAGDVSFGNDIVFTNPVSASIKSEGPLTVESGSVLGNLDLTLRTYNLGGLVLDNPGGVTLNQAQTWTTAASTTAMNITDAAGATILNIDSTNSRVGIGNTAPAALLSVGSSSQLVVNSSGYLGIGTTNPNDYAEVGGGVTIGSGYLGANTAPANGLLVQGNVGIGNTAPGSLLSVGSTGLFGVTTSGYLGIGTTNPNDYAEIGGGMTIGSGYLGTNTAPANGLLIEGRLGVGTTNPAYTLDVNGNLNTTGLYLSTNQVTSTASELNLLDGTTATAGGLMYGDGTKIAQNAGALFWDNGNAKLGIGTTAPASALEVNGEVRITGLASADYYVCVDAEGDLYESATACSGSDVRLKENITAMDNALASVLKMNPVTFNWKDRAGKGDQQEVGFIAQEMELLFPQVVRTNPDGYKGIKYDVLTAVLTKAIQEQQGEINAMRELMGINTVESTESSQSSTSATMAANASPSAMLETMQTLYNDLKGLVEALGLSKDDKGLAVNTNLNVLGDTTLRNLNVTGDIMAGLIKIDTLNNEINLTGPSCFNTETGVMNNSLCQAQTIYLQKNLAGNVDMFNGALVFEPDGTIKAKGITAEVYGVASTGQSVGDSTIATGETNIVINSTAASGTYKVFVTATSNTNGVELFVKDKLDGQFTVALSGVAPSDIKFDWWIVKVD